MATLSWVWDRNNIVSRAPQAAAPVTSAQGTLAAAQHHEVCEVVQVTAAGALGERMMEMGLVPGTCVTVVRRGLGGDPLQVAVRGAHLSLRRDQAADVVVRYAHCGRR